MVILIVTVGQLAAQTVTEDFEGATFPPVGWTRSPDNDASVARDSTIAHSTKYSVRLIGNGSYLQTANAIASPGVISFWGRKTSSANTKMAVYTSNDGTTQGALLGAEITLTTTFTQYSVDVTGAGHSNVYIRFVRASQPGVSHPVIDDIQIAASAVYYRSKTTGNWGSTSTWEISLDGTIWTDATAAPTATNSLSITILNTHTVSVAANVTADQVVVNSGGTLQVNSGYTLNLANGTGDDLTVNGNLTVIGAVTYDTGATMAAGSGSTIKFAGTTGGQTTGTGFPSSVYNLIIDNPNGVTLSGNLTITTQLTMTSGTLALSTYNLSYGTSAALVYNGTAAQTAGPEWLAAMSRPVTISNTSSSGLTLGSNKSTSSSVTITNGGTLTMGTSVISGTGSFTLDGGGTIKTANTSGLNGSVTTDTYNFSQSANYVYNGSNAQVTGSYLPSTVNNFTVDNPNGVTWSGSVTVSGSLQVLQGNIELSDQYFRIPVNTITVNAFNVATSTPDLYPGKVNRQWDIYGTWASGSITCRFFWNDTDDNSYDWVGLGVTPSVYRGATEYQATSSSLGTALRWVEVSIPSLDGFTKGTFNLGPAEDGTLPVELSSFTAVISATDYVQLQWVTQSETNVSGYRLYRGSDLDLSTAVMLNAFIEATNTSQMQVYVYWDDEVWESGTYYYWLQNLDFDGGSAFHGPISITVNLNDSGSPVIPVIQGISSIYPNPFNPNTAVRLGIVRPGNVKVAVYNTRGQMVRELFEGFRDQGTHTLQWDGTDANGSALPSGMYVIRMTSGTQVYQRKAILMK